MNVNIVRDFGSQELKLKHWGNILRHNRSVNFRCGRVRALSEKISANTEVGSCASDFASLIVRNSSVDNITDLVEVITLISFVGSFQNIVPIFVDKFERMEI